MDEQSQFFLVKNQCCTKCGRRDSYPYTIEVASIEAEDYGWSVQGYGELPDTRSLTGLSRLVSCPHCAYMHDAVVRAIPIECESYVCPKCDSGNTLDYKVKKIETAGLSFLFEATITCKKCKAKSAIRSIAEKFFEVVKIKVGPKGVTVEKA